MVGGILTTALWIQAFLLKGREETRVRNFNDQLCDYESMGARA